MFSPHSGSRRILMALGVAMALAAAPRDAQAQGDQLQRVLAAEDARGRGPEGIAPLLEALASPDPSLRRVAVRGIGRLERPDLIDRVRPLLTDANEGVRAEAAQAIAQAAQGLIADSADVRRAGVRRVLELLRTAGIAERRGAVRGAYARSIGRLPYPDSALAAEAQTPLAALAEPTGDDARRQTFDVLHGVYDLARSRRRTGAITPELLALAEAHRHAPRGSVRRAAESPIEVRIRRLAVLVLGAAGVPSDSIALDAIRDSDAQMRRLAVALLPNANDSAVRRRVITAALGDPSFLVRFEGVRGWRQHFGAVDCATGGRDAIGGFRDRIASLVGDRSSHVKLIAIDAIGTCSDKPWAASFLGRYVAIGATPMRLSGRDADLIRAHALVAWARADSVAPREAVVERARRPDAVTRVYAARAAAIVGDVTTLYQLAIDTVANVREAAIDGLATVAGHAADTLYVRALESPDYQVSLAAAKALKGTTGGAAIVTPLFEALDRITREGRDNSRDPRVEILDRISELASRESEARLRPYVSDFDPAVASRAAAVVSTWTGALVAATPRPNVTVSDELSRIARTTNLRLRFDMGRGSGDRTFVVRLRGAAAPATAARLVALAKKGYYDALTFHRIEPTFVIQGGSPRATEYVGDGPFMRDELDDASHVYGTVGISTRGRDTGDAQIFVNLTDNYRLDHNYTVVGEVIEGMDLVDEMLEGDRIARVRVVGTW